MLKRLLSRFSANMSTVGTRSPSLIEELEGRRLLHNPTVISVVADNRGEVTIRLDAASSELSASIFNRNSVQMYLAGPDGHVGNGDDIRVGASIKFTPGTQRLLVRGDIPAGFGYRIKLVASRISPGAGNFLDGDFNGRFPSGNGVAGGNFEFQVKNDRSTTPTVRMASSAGTIDLLMRGDVAPKSIKNFINYANTKRYDNIFFTRNIPGFIIQGGSLQINSSNAVVETTVDAPVQNEFNLSNIRGTLAFAKSGGGPDPVNSATNQFFFNLDDNSANLNNQNGGFTVFAQVKNSSGLAVMDAVAGKDVVALRNDLTGHGVLPAFTATGVTNTPVNNKNILTGAVEVVDPQTNEQQLVVTGGFDASRDLVTIRRVSVLSKVAAL